MAAQEALYPNPLEPKAHFPSRIHPSPPLQRKCDTLSQSFGYPRYLALFARCFVGGRAPNPVFCHRVGRDGYWAALGGREA